MSVGRTTRLCRAGRSAPTPRRPRTKKSTRARARSMQRRTPVLSEQMTDVQPSVSTLGSERTIALRAAILRVPSARQIVTTAGRPSGMAATASATAILK